MNNSKKKCVICGRQHIIKTNKSGIICHYCKTNRKSEVKQYLAARTPLSWAIKFRQLCDSQMKPDTIILKFMRYCDEQEREVYKAMRE